MDAIRKSTWRPEPEESQNCSGQFARGFPGLDSNDSQAGPSPIPGIFPTPDTANNDGLSTPVAETTDAIGNQNGLTRFCSGTEAGCSSAAECIAKIKRIWAHGPASTLELARVVCAARNQLQRGEWTALWNSRRLPFAKRKADMLVRVGDGLAWANEQTFAHLPIGWSTLYQLARLQRPIFEQLLQAGTIHPGLTLREAKELVARFDPRDGARAKRTNHKDRLRRFLEFVRNTVDDWEPEERVFAAQELNRLTGEIGAVESALFGRNRTVGFFTS